MSASSSTTTLLSEETTKRYELEVSMLNKCYLVERERSDKLLVKTIKQREEFSMLAVKYDEIQKKATALKNENYYLRNDNAKLKKMAVYGSNTRDLRIQIEKKFTAFERKHADLKATIDELRKENEKLKAQLSLHNNDGTPNAKKVKRA